MEHKCFKSTYNMLDYLNKARLVSIRTKYLVSLILIFLAFHGTHAAFSPLPTTSSLFGNTIKNSKTAKNINNNIHINNNINMNMNNKHLVLVGGGHGHVQVIKALNKKARPSNLSVTLIDLQSDAFYSGMIPGCVSQLYTPEETQIHLRPLAEWANITFICAAVVDVDFDLKQLTLENGQHVHYDCVSFDIGSTTRGLTDIPGVKEYTISTRPISSLLEKFENSERAQKDITQVVVVGGGAAGIELTMAIRARWNPDGDILLLNGGSAIMPHESPKCREALDNILKDNRILVQNSTTVTEITESHVCILKSKEETDQIAYSHCIWATGAAPHYPLVGRLEEKGLALNSGWIRVGPTLQSVSHPEVFAAGDCAQMEGLKHGKRSPPKAGVYAVRSGPILIHNLISFIFHPNGNDLHNYDPQDEFLKLLMCGDGTALGFRFGLPLYGKWVWQLKDQIDRMFMNLFDARYLPVLDDNEIELDESQYDAAGERPEPLPVMDAVDLLKRTDDDVDFQQAWNVLRDMMADDDYQKQILEQY